MELQEEEDVDTTTNEIKRMVNGISNFIIVIDHAR